MSVYSKFKTNPKSEKQGIELNYGDFRVTIRRAGGSNKAYGKRLEELTQPYLRAIKLGSMDENVAIDLTHKVFAETVVADWKVQDSEAEGEMWVSGIADPDTNEIVPVTPEVIARVFKAVPDLFIDLKEAATNSSNFRNSSDKDAVGN